MSFPPRPELPPTEAARGGEERVREAESVEEEEAYEPGEWALALMYEDDAGPDVYASMDVDPANAPLLPMPTAVPPPPLGSCEQRHRRFHAAEGANQHHLTSVGRQEAGLLEGALERYKFQHPHVLLPQCYGSVRVHVSCGRAFGHQRYDGLMPGLQDLRTSQNGPVSMH